MNPMKQFFAVLLLLCLLLGLAGCGQTDLPEPTAAASAQPSPESVEESLPPSPAGETGSEQDAVPEESPGAAQETEPVIASEAASVTDQGQTTLMLYMVGSDLEQKQRAATADLVEISKSGVDLEHTNILICAGGSGRWWNNLADPEAITILRLTDSGYLAEDSLPLQSMGDPACLTAFVNLCTERYPADHYALVFWDHGNGPVIGYGKDELFGQDHLTLTEMRQAMDETAFADSLRLDLVGFDACLMASAELACVWRSYADILVASQETEPGFGWNYAFLSRCGKCSARELACDAADAFMQYAQEAFSKRDDYYTELTLSVLDLSKSARLEDAVNALFRSAAEHVSGDYIRLAQARVGIRAMGRASTGSEYDLVDLMTVVDNMAADFPSESEAVRAAAEDMVIYSVSNTPQCTGMSLYYPYYNKQYYQRAWKDTYRDLAVFPGYLNYLERYETIWLGTDMQRYFSEALTLEEGAAPSTYTLQLTEEQAAVFAKANYYILSRFGDELYMLIYCSNDVSLQDGKLTASFDGNVIYYQTDFHEKGIPLIRTWDTVDGITDYSALGIYLTRGDFFDNQDRLYAEGRFSVNRETGEMLFKGFYPDEEDSEFSGGKQDAIDLSDWDVIEFYNVRPRYITRDEDGRIANYWDWPESSWITWAEVPIMDNPHFTFEPIYDDGTEYYILINVMDLQGNEYSSELFPIQLAPAPEEEAIPTDTVTWLEGDSVTLLEVNNVTLRIHTASSITDGNPVYYLEAENRNPFPVIAHLGGEGTILNGKIDCGSSYLAYASLEPESTETIFMEPLTTTPLLSHEERLVSLVTPCEVFRQDTSATFYRGRVGLEIPQELPQAVRWDPLLEARAEQQLLLDENGIRMTLFNLGAPTDSSYTGQSDSLLISLGIENHTGKAKKILLDGYVVNGIFLPAWEELTLQDDQSWYPLLAKSESLIRSLEYSGQYGLMEDEASLPSLHSISSFSVCLTVDGKTYVCPVKLSGQGNDRPIEPTGSLLFEDEKIQILLYRADRITTEEGAEGSIWYLWMVNRGETTESLMGSVSKSYPLGRSCSWVSVAPGSASFFSVADLSEDGKSFSLSFGSEGDYRIGNIVLPEP